MGALYYIINVKCSQLFLFKFFVSEDIESVLEGTVIKPKINFIEGLNKLNSALTKQNFDEDIFKGILEKYGFGPSFLIKKLFSNIYNYPWIITYLNKYMNYLGVVSADLVEFTKSYRYILSCNGVLDSRRFYFMKMSACKDDLQGKIISLLEKYFSERFDIHFNYKELLFYYNLYLNGIISNQDIHEIDLLVNNNSKTINLPDFTPEKEKPVSVDKLIKQYSESSNGIDFINNEIYKRKIDQCSEDGCFGRDIVPFDGNIDDINNVDVMIVNLNPDLNDLKEKRTFREKSIIRQNIGLFPKEIKWILVNLIPCAFKSKSEIGKDIDEINEQTCLCENVVLNFIKENIKPKITVLIGQEAALPFIPAADFEKSLGNLVNGKYISVLHPNSMKQAKAQIKGKKYWESVQNAVAGLLNSAAEKEEEKPEESSSDQPELEKIKKNDKMLLLDVKEIENGNSILMVFTDEEGNKHYQKKRNISTGYIKESSFKDCDILSDLVDSEFTMTKSEKIKLTKLLREKMAKLKGT